MPSSLYKSRWMWKIIKIRSCPKIWGLHWAGSSVPDKCLHLAWKSATKFWLWLNFGWRLRLQHERGGGCPVTERGPAPPRPDPTQPQGVHWVVQGQQCSRNSSQKVNVSLLTRSRERRGDWRGSLALCLCCLGSPAGRFWSQQSLCLREQLGYNCSQLCVGELKRMSPIHRLVGYLRWGGTSEDHLFQPPAPRRVMERFLKYSCLWKSRASSSCFWISPARNNLAERLEQIFEVVYHSLQITQYICQLTCPHFSPFHPHFWLRTWAKGFRNSKEA